MVGTYSINIFYIIYSDINLHFKDYSVDMHFF